MLTVKEKWFEAGVNELHIKPCLPTKYYFISWYLHKITFTKEDSETSEGHDKNGLQVSFVVVVWLVFAYELLKKTTATFR